MRVTAAVDKIGFHVDCRCGTHKRITRRSANAPAASYVENAARRLQWADKVEIRGMAGKIAANGYNAVVLGVGAFGTSGMQGNNPDVGAGVAVATTGAGANAVRPSSIGNVVNQIPPGSAEPIQTAIQNQISPPKE